MVNPCTSIISPTFLCHIYFFKGLSVLRQFLGFSLAINLSLRTMNTPCWSLISRCTYSYYLSWSYTFQKKRTWPMLHLPCYNASSDSVGVIHLWKQYLVLCAFTLILGLIVFFWFVPSGTISYMEGNRTPPRVTLVPSALPKPCGFFSAIESLNTLKLVSACGRSYGGHVSRHNYWYFILDRFSYLRLLKIFAEMSKNCVYHITLLEFNASCNSHRSCYPHLLS
jgi:hypothetical protein